MTGGIETIALAFLAVLVMLAISLAFIKWLDRENHDAWTKTHAHKGIGDLREYANHNADLLSKALYTALEDVETDNKFRGDFVPYEMIKKYIDVYRKDYE